MWCATSTSHTLLLRVSGVTHNRAYDLEAVTGGAQSDGGVPHGRLLERRALIDRLYAENHTYAAIGRRLSVSKNTISRMSAPRAATTCRTPENSRLVAVGAENRLRKASKPAPNTPQPSIAVLPFQNMSGDPKQEYFADGMVEEIITALSRIRWLFVIARNSSFTYKGQAVDVKPRPRDALRRIPGS